jgi:hypothetical protein
MLSCFATTVQATVVMVTLLARTDARLFPCTRTTLVTVLHSLKAVAPPAGLEPADSLTALMTR